MELVYTLMSQLFLHFKRKGCLIYKPYIIEIIREDFWNRRR